MEVCIVTKRSFLSFSTTQRQNHGAFNFTSLNDAILQLPRLSVYALCGYIQPWSHVLLPVALSVFATFGCLNCIFGKLWCSNAAYISQWISLQNKVFSSFLSGAATCCSHYFMSWLLIHLWVYFVLTNSSILAQPENNAVDRQIYMIIVITNNAFRPFYWTQHDNSCSQRRLRVHSDNKSTAEPDKLT